MRLRWSARALRYLASIIEDLSLHSPTGARRIAARVDGAVSHLRQHPEMGRRGDEADTRELVVSGTNYLVVYRVTEREIVILSIFHARQSRPSASA